LAKLLLICVVDDDESVRDALEDLLSGHGYQVRGFASAEQVLMHERLAELDCVVSDYHMPGRNGLDLYRALRARGHGVPFILMTAFASPRVREIALAEGISHVLAKPFAPDEILQAVATVVS